MYDSQICIQTIKQPIFRYEIHRFVLPLGTKKWNLMPHLIFIRWIKCARSAFSTPLFRLICKTVLLFSQNINFTGLWLELISNISNWKDKKCNLWIIPRELSILGEIHYKMTFMLTQRLLNWLWLMMRISEKNLKLK